MSDVPIIKARVVFRLPDQGGRAAPPADSDQYRPHVVVGPRDQERAVLAADGRTLTENYLGVVFQGDGQIMDFHKEWDITLCLWNPAADYSGLIPGATFTIREAGRIVGSGEVLSGD